MEGDSGQAPGNSTPPAREILQEVTGENRLTPTLLDGFLDRLARRNYSPNTIRDYRSALRRFVRHFHGVPLSAFSPEHLEQWLDGLHVSPQTWCSYLEHIRSFFAWCARRGYIEGNPADDVDKPRTHPKHRPAPRREEFEALYRACETPEERLLVAFAYFTGLRLSEFLNLRIRDLDLQKRRAWVNGKGEKPRAVFWPPILTDLLTAHIGPRPGTAWLFESSWHRGYRRAPDWIEETLRRLGTRAQLPYPVTAHVLRHGFARLCKTQGIPLEVAARLMGHADVNTTASLYGRLDEDDLQREYDGKILS